MKTLTPKTYVYAHRGASGYAPENTLEAFALAIEQDADGVELDVRFTKDGKVIVLHDATIDRTSNGQGAVLDYTYEELLGFDFGYKFYKERRGIKLPLLEDVYKLMAPAGKTVNVEIKSDDPAICAECHKIAEKCGMTDKVIYSCFDHLQLVEMLKVAPDAFVAPLYSRGMVKVWDYCKNMNASATHPEKGQIRLDPNYVSECHKLGVRVHPWTVNHEEDMLFLIQEGCDAIITNYPDVARKLVEENQ
jgi:glycerophosphoryl diester phosphodiesterase